MEAADDPNRPLSQLSIAAIVCAIGGVALPCCPVFPLLAVVLGFVARSRIRRGAEVRGAGLALAAMLLGDSVAGGQVHGSWPLEEITDPTPSGPGGLGIKRDARDLFSEVLQNVFAADKATLQQVFPGLQSQQTGLFHQPAPKK